MDQNFKVLANSRRKCLVFVLGQEKVVLFPDIGRLKIFLSPTHPHKSNVYGNIYFFVSKKHTHKQKNFHLQIYSY